MKLSELRTFNAIVETGSLVRASERLNVTQSTVTARLQSLEGELGQPLINRQKGGASLTPAGQRLLRYTQTIADLWQQAQQETYLPDALSAVCNIGCDPDLWPGYTDKLLDFIREKIPQVAVSVWQGSSAELSSWLKNGLVDLTIGYAANVTQKQRVIQAIEDKLVLVSTSPESPIKFDPGYIFVEAGEEFGREHATAYADADTARISFGSAQLAMSYMMKNGGSAYLPTRLVKEEIKMGRLHLLKGAPVFLRQAHIVANSQTTEAWPWFDSLLEEARKLDDG